MMNTFINIIRKCVPLWAMSSVLFLSTAMSQGTATYKLTFTSTWTASTHPTNYPSNPHFSGLIGGTHNSSVEFWSTGKTASNGIKSMAEFGSKGTLRSEINQAKANNNADAIIDGGGLGRPPTSTTTTFTIRPPWNLVTVTSMLAPSPDWFVGVSGLNLLDGNNNWQQKVEVELFVYDAGTDSGSDYTSANQATNPRENISRISTSPFLVNGTVKSVGSFVFELQSSTPQVSLSVDKNSVEEGEAVTVTVELSEALTSNVTIPLNLTSGTAESGDYDSTSPVNVTITGGQTEAEYTINTFDDDDLDNESFTVSIDGDNLPSEVVLGSPASANITITDPDAPEVSLSVDESSVEEGESVTVTVELSEALADDVTIPIELTSGTAESDDYDSASPVNVTITGGQTEAERIINTYEDDDTRDESFTVSIDGDNLPSGVVLGSPASANITITDPDVPEVSLSVDKNSVEEGESVTVTVELSEALASNVTIPIELTSGTAESGDYDSTSPVRVTITGGQTEAEHIINTYDDDDLDNESFTVQIDTDNLPSEVVAGSPLSAEVTITDSDAPEVSLSVDKNSVAEGEAVTVTIELSEAQTGNVIVPILLLPGTAESDDYDSASPVNVTITGGQTEAEHTINTYVDDDTKDEIFTVAIDANNLPSGFIVGSRASATIIIIDPDIPEVFLSVDENSVAEGKSVTVTIELSDDLFRNVAIPIELTSDTAESDDYDSASPVNIEIINGQTTAEYVIKTYEDNDTEDEIFTVAIDADNLPSDVVAAGSPLSAEITIKDVRMPEVSLSVDQNPVAEGTSVTVTITLSEAQENNVTIPLKLTSGTAEPDDYDSTTPANVVITSGQTAAKHIIDTYEDTDIEDETFTVAIDAEHLPPGMILGSPTSAEVKITDNDRPEVKLLVDQNSVAEGKPVTVMIMLSDTLENNVTISLILTPGTAELDDYDSTSPVNVDILGGQTEAEHIINTYEDADAENETFTVAIDTGRLLSGITLGDLASIEVTIIDNDTPGILAPTSVEIDEGKSEEVRISLMTQPSSDVAVTITGYENTDLEPNQGVLTFTHNNYNTSQTVTLTTAEDSDLLNDEVTLTLEASGGGYDEVSHTLAVTIRDNMDVSVEDEEPAISITLWGNYPNPVSDLTKIVFDLSEPAQISIRVIDLLGRTVQMTPYGWYEAGRDHAVEIGTENLTSGVYYYTLRVDMGDQVIQRSKAMSVVR